MNRVNRYLFSSFLSTFASLFATLFLIVSIVFFIQIARITSYIDINFLELVNLYLFMLPEILLFTVPIGFFVSLAMSFFRLSRENESIVIFTLGYSPKDIAKFFLKISTIVSIILLFIALVAMPTALNLYSSFVSYKKTKLSLNIKPSEFGQRFGSWMIFIDRQNIDENLSRYENIVLYNNSIDDERFITASSGDITNEDARLNLILKDGYIYDIKSNKWNVSKYDTLTIRSNIQDKYGDNFSIIKYWQQVNSDPKVAKKLTIYTLIALFPLASVLFALSFGIVTYRYEKGIIYIGIFAVLAAYFTAILLMSQYPFYAIPLIFTTTILASIATFKHKVIKKY
ncbi:LptF/LptG family permease [Campylobacter porcelli]|uniref:LptF/LptG family permease n=1 Tax=Campylobacter porcelli TaxID=1660073 RepID=A0ABU7M324_9BACT|nr:LptF/LptG family permease [Campylobacter sp. CX2-4855-23]